MTWFLVCCFILPLPDTFGLLVVMFFRFVTSGEIRKRAEFFEPFILGLTNATVEQVCSIKTIQPSINTHDFISSFQ